MPVACATTIIIPAAMFDLLLMPKDVIMPIMIGTTAALLAVALGTAKLSIIVTAIAPIIIRLVLVPTFDKVYKAILLSSPVKVMAPAINRAPQTNANAELENPDNAKPIAVDVPYRTSGFLTLGAVPIKKAIKTVIIIALASYETASVTQTITAKANIASIRCPATGRSPDRGIKRTPIRAKTPINNPMGSLDLPAGEGGIAFDLVILTLQYSLI
ncbi:hypothetical protein CKCE_0515 [Candidatus Kinetoplastibacterium crithidii (ex Angomonas deanei ATCC 30255)]|nr:hypothetical protein CKCE_0515 [Candidatus Kinetoplastibacterium crithidii (ex Angomonas deanei ATCC 30255)]